MKYALILIALCSNLAHGQYSLGLNLEKNHDYFLNINTILQANTEMNGQKMQVISNMTAFARFRVVRASELEYELEASYDSIHVAIKSPMGKMEFSTNNVSGNNDMGAGGLNDKHFTVVLLKNGAIKKIENHDSTGYSSMLKNFPVAEGIRQMLMMGRFHHSFNHEAMRKNLEKLTAIFPNKKVNLNDTWGETIIPDSGTDNSIKTNYQLTDYHSGVATIKGNSETKLTGNQKQEARFPAMIDLRGKSESTLKVEAATGWIREGEIKEELNGQIKLKTTAGSQEGDTCPIQIEATVKISGR